MSGGRPTGSGKSDWPRSATGCTWRASRRSAGRRSWRGAPGSRSTSAGRRRSWPRKRRRGGMGSMGGPNLEAAGDLPLRDLGRHGAEPRCLLALWRVIVALNVALLVVLVASLDAALIA